MLTSDVDTLYSAFYYQAMRHPEKIALIDYSSGRRYSYGQVLSATNQVCQDLVSRFQLVAGQRVALMLSNQTGFVVSAFALWQAGAVLVPLNPGLSGEESARILQASKASGLIIAAEAYQTLEIPFSEENTFWTFPIDSTEFSLLGDIPDNASIPQVSATLSSADLAALIYTSGTTGKPKGVMLSHQNLLADAMANKVVIEAVPEDVFVTVSPLFHVFGLTNILLTSLLTGASMILVRKFSPKSILDAISTYQVTFLAAVPTMYQMMLPLLPNPAYNLSSLRVCHSGAAPMPVPVFEAIEAAFGAPVQEGYGQSEASSIVTSNPLHGVRKPGSIGKALQGISVEVVNEADEVQPAGESGELRILGNTVMCGYWENPEATRRVLKNGWLYTGDMGYTDNDGYLYLAGRKDDLINTAGSKVYPSEVEAALYRHPDVVTCAVCAEASELYFQQVAAYVVLTPEASVSALELQRFCRQSLLDYKVPKSIYFVQSIPQGATGKILRHRLSLESQP